MVIGQNGVAGLIVPEMEKMQLGLEHATIQLQPMEESLAHLETTQLPTPLMASL
jgi:hypothetical protein